MTEKAGAPNPEHAFDPAKQDELARAVEKLNPEEAAFFLFKLESSIKKRKIQLTGYLVALLVWLVGMFFALAYYGLATLAVTVVGGVDYDRFATWNAVVAAAGKN